MYSKPTERPCDTTCPTAVAYDAVVRLDPVRQTIMCSTSYPTCVYALCIRICKLAPPLLCKIVLPFNSAGFDNYAQLPHSERIELVRSASNCLSAWVRSEALQSKTESPLEQQSTEAASSDGKRQVERDMLEDRRQSGAQASSSQLSAAQALASSTWTTQGSYTTSSSNGSSNHGGAATVDDHPNTRGYASTGLGNTPKPASDSALNSHDGHSEQISTSFDALGIGSIAQAELPQPASVIQPHVQPLGYDEHQSSQAGPPVHTQNGTHGILSDSASASDTALLDQTTAQTIPSDVTFDGEATQQGAKKVVKPETIAFRDSFAQSAAHVKGGKASADARGVEQRTAAWHALRDSRLTASAFANALG